MRLLIRIMFFHIHIKIYLGNLGNGIRLKVFACKYKILFTSIKIYLQQMNVDTCRKLNPSLFQNYK